MTIIRRLGIGYSIVGAACVLLLSWLAYHEFVEEPAVFAARGVSELHRDTEAEFFTVCFLALVPLLLGFGWWWTRRALRPLNELTLAAERMGTDNLLSYVPRQTRDDEVGRLAAVFASMTERLNDAFQQIREFTLHASHELKTPLTIMQAELQTALRDASPLSIAHAEWIQSIQDELHRLVRIVDSLTLLTKADVGLVPLERSPVQFGGLVREAYEDALVLAQASRFNVILDECASLEIIGDRHRLRQMLLILVDNAVKYNEPTGDLHLNLIDRAGFAEFQITNAGQLTPETQRRLFRRFMRGENAVAKVEGCGLGLTIAQWIARAHGGTIEIRSEAGKVTALVRLPIA